MAYQKNEPEAPWTAQDFILLRKGVSWGDLTEPITNGLIKPKTVRFIIELPKVKVVLEEGEIDEDEDEVEVEEVEQVLYPQIEFSIDDEERPPPIWRPTEHGYCLFCEYQVHSNPPPHFTEQQRKHCCGWCQTSLGRGHGPHCQRCL
jgi:hypothetical protein